MSRREPDGADNTMPKEAGAIDTSERYEPVEDVPVQYNEDESIERVEKLNKEQS